MSITLNNLFTEQAQIVSAIVPVDFSAAANNGDWVSLKNYDHCAVILFKGAGTAGDDPTLTLQQATDVSGTGAKALNFTNISVKQGTLTGQGTFTQTSQAAANTYTDLVSAEIQAIWVVDIQAQQLDVENGFDCLRVTVADVGSNAQVGCALYILYGARYGKSSVPSAIID